MLFELLYGYHPFNKDNEDLSNEELQEKLSTVKLDFPLNSNIDAKNFIA